MFDKIIVWQMTDFHIHISQLYINVYCSNLWESNHRDGTVGHKTVMSAFNKLIIIMYNNTLRYSFRLKATVHLIIDQFAIIEKYVLGQNLIT